MTDNAGRAAKPDNAGRVGEPPRASRIETMRSRLNPSLLVGGLLVALVVGMALLSFVWVPYPPDLVIAEDRLAPIFSDGHVLGTDKLGRDSLSQILVGARTTLLVGIVAVGVAAVVGVPLGLLAAMAWPWLGNLIMRASDLVLAFPALLLAIMLAAVYGGSVVTAMIAIGIATVPAFARVVRSGAMTVLTQDYVLAARVAGRGKVAIALKHVLPNVTSLIIVQASVAFAIAILAEAALSFLGLGAPPDVPSWGRMLQESQSLLSQAPRLALIPGSAIAIAVLGFNLLGDGLRDMLDPRLAKTSEEAR